jgi:hypothetical protein
VIRAVARPPDVTARASATGKFVNATGTATGVWTAEPVRLTLLPDARSDGHPLVRSASCTFRFKGKLDSDPQTVVTGSAEVELVAAPGVLRVGGGDVLRDGDRASERFGNSVAVTSTATWRCA